MITKTDFIAYLDAPRHLWAIKNNKLSEKEINVFIRHLFNQGYEVEEQAEKYIQNILIPSYKIDPQNVFLQPTHIHGNFQARTDVLIKNVKTNKWDIYEIKSTNDVKKTHKYDATFQYLVFRESYDIGKVHILHLNKDYIRSGDLSLSELFTVSDITEEVQKLTDEVLELRQEALTTARINNLQAVEKCIKPKECPCIAICHPDLPEYSIYDINRLSGNQGKMRDLIDQGIESVFDVPKDFLLSKIQRYQVDIAQNNKVVIDQSKIQKDLSGVTYPLYFIDYESYNPAIPMYDGYKPFDQMPFQWSLHIQQQQDGELEHFEFIETEQIDPIPNFLTELQKHIGEEGSLIVWNKSFEGTQNNRMGEIHPQFADFCLNMNGRIYDLMDIFQKQWYADPKLKGSYSIKQVLPLFAPDFSYKELEIGEGATAMTSWYEMAYKNTEVSRNESIKGNLLRYCEMDTLAMVKIFESLKKYFINEEQKSKRTLMS